MTEPHEQKTKTTIAQTAAATVTSMIALMACARLAGPPLIYHRRHRDVPPTLWNLASRTRRGCAAGASAGPVISKGEEASYAMLEALAFVAGLDDVAVVREAVEQRGGHLGVAKDGRPFTKGQIGRHDDRGALVEAADQMEQ